MDAHGSTLEYSRNVTARELVRNARRLLDEVERDGISLLDPLKVRVLELLSDGRVHTAISEELSDTEATTALGWLEVYRLIARSWRGYRITRLGAAVLERLREQDDVGPEQENADAAADEAHARERRD